MRAVVQRSLAAKVTIAGQTVGAIDHGFVVLLGVGPEDTSADSDYLAEKSVNCGFSAMMPAK